jgi:hypothetical protein
LPEAGRSGTALTHAVGQWWDSVPPAGLGAGIEVVVG